MGLLQCILIACIVDFSLISAHPHSQIINEFQNLFDAIGKSDAKSSEIHRNILKQEIAKEQQAFHTLKEKLNVARNRNSNKIVHLYGQSNTENVITAKRHAFNREHWDVDGEPKSIKNELVVNQPTREKRGSRCQDNDEQDLGGENNGGCCHDDEQNGGGCCQDEGEGGHGGGCCQDEDNGGHGGGCCQDEDNGGHGGGCCQDDDGGGGDCCQQVDNVEQGQIAGRNHPINHPSRYKRSNLHPSGAGQEEVLNNASHKEEPMRSLLGESFMDNVKKADENTLVFFSTMLAKLQSYLQNFEFQAAEVSNNLHLKVQGFDDWIKHTDKVLHHALAIVRKRVNDVQQDA